MRDREAEQEALHQKAGEVPRSGLPSLFYLCRLEGENGLDIRYQAPAPCSQQLKCRSTPSQYCRLGT